ncbi:MAG TPA: helix-turn-helix transcriptional regulator [Beijerinckiaceae bacterium]|jgi:transcriptional regulator with XRE-family HTH domain
MNQMLATTTSAPTSAPTSRSVGDLLRIWRQRRRLSQLDLALDADISQRHLSFVESGRATPSREMVLRLAAQLDVPLRERNALLLAAGYAPTYRERSLDDPDLLPARRAIDLLLKAQEPYPALAVDRRWTMVAANAVVPLLLAGVADASLLQPPVNVLRLSLHPGGLAPAIVNLPEWRAHVLERLERQIDVAADPVLAELRVELAAYPVAASTAQAPLDPAGLVVPLVLRTPAGTLSFLSTTTVFGTPVDVTLSELAIESFFPTDAETAEALRRLSAP